MRPIVIAAGGTGGHFFPAEALAAELIARGYRVVLMTDARSAAARSAVFAGREQHVLKGAGLAGRGLRRGVTAGLALAGGTWQARRLLRGLDAAALVGFGGYPTVAPVLAARSLRRRPAILLQEQNAVLGRANRTLCRLADILALGFPATRGVPRGIAAAVTGNPVRQAVQHLAALTYAPAEDLFHLLVLGGSLGARVFSDVVPAAVAGLPAALRARVRITQQCRAEDMGRVCEAYSRAGVPARLAVFFDDVASLLQASHLVVARAGASTCAELMVAGRPSILVPLPGAIDDHQSANAAALAAHGAATVRAQKDFSETWLADVLERALTDSPWLAATAAAVAALGMPAAASVLADLVERQMAGAEVLS